MKTAPISTKNAPEPNFAPQQSARHLLSPPEVSENSLCAGIDLTHNVGGRLQLVDQPDALPGP